MKEIFFLFVSAFVFVPSATQAQGGWQIERTILSRGSSPIGTCQRQWDTLRD